MFLNIGRKASIQTISSEASTPAFIPKKTVELFKFALADLSIFECSESEEENTFLSHLAVP